MVESCYDAEDDEDTILSGYSGSQHEYMKGYDVRPDGDEQDERAEFCEFVQVAQDDTEPDLWEPKHREWDDNPDHGTFVFVFPRASNNRHESHDNSDDEEEEDEEHGNGTVECYDKDSGEQKFIEEPHRMMRKIFPHGKELIRR